MASRSRNFLAVAFVLAPWPVMIWGSTAWRYSLSILVAAFVIYALAQAPRRYRDFRDSMMQQASDHRGGILWKSYPEGTLPAAPPRPERNQPCPCGSGEKYKRCHGAE